nr:dephospho-CoA kinase [Eubacterium sp.]
MVIGITGGVGSGKSTVLSLLEKEYQAEICMADELGHEVMRRGGAAYEKILETFGEEVLDQDGEIHRDTLAKIVYGDSGKLKVLNQIIHPMVLNEMRLRAENTKENDILVLETAILFETGCDEFCDEVWGVITDNEVRMKRLEESRGYTREKALSIMAKQLSNEELQGRCDRVIINDGDA